MSLMLSTRPVAQTFVDDDDEVFDQMVPDAITGRVLPPTSSSYRYSHRVQRLVFVEFNL